MRGGWTRWMLRGAIALAMALVALSYLSPHLAVDLANQIWACF